MGKKLTNRVAVVNGGRAGIGLGAAKRFAAESAQEFITRRRQSKLHKASDKVGSNVTAVRRDSSDLAKVFKCGYAIHCSNHR